MPRDNVTVTAKFPKARRVATGTIARRPKGAKTVTFRRHRRIGSPPYPQSRNLRARRSFFSGLGFAPLRLGANRETIPKSGLTTRRI
jgi:hypothetical protein